MSALTLGQLDDLSRHRKVWVKKTLCYVCHCPIVVMLDDDDLRTVRRRCECHDATVPFSILTSGDEWIELCDEHDERRRTQNATCTT